MSNYNSNVSYIEDTKSRFNRQKNKVDNIPDTCIDLTTEKTVLAEIVLSEIEGIKVVSNISSLLESHDFYDSRNEMVYRMIVKLHYENVPVDFINLSSALEEQEYRQSNCLEEIGGINYLKEISEQEFAIPENLEHHIKILIKKSCLRGLLLQQTDVVNMMKSHSLSIERYTEIMSDYLTEVKDRLNSISTEDAPELSSLADEFQKLLHSNVEKYKIRIANSSVSGSSIIYGLPTGIDIIDNSSSGIQEQQPMGIMGDKNMGKTAFLFTVITGLVKHNEGIHIVLFTSGEINQQNVLYRLYSMGSELFGTKTVTMKQMKSGNMDEESFESVRASIQAFKKVQLHLFTRGIDIDKFTTSVKKLENKHGKIDFLAIDYLQNIIVKKPIQRTEVVPEIIDEIKMLNDDLIYQPATCFVTQQNGKMSHRGDNTPRIGDAYHGGRMEDIVQFYYGLGANEEDEDSVIVHNLKNKEDKLAEPCVLKRSPTTLLYS